MSRSRRKTPIFGIAGHSEKEDKRLANRMFRKREKEKIAKGQFDKLPINMNEVMNVWSMSKDGKCYWIDGKDRDNGKFMRKYFLKH